jgi:6-pyruvoyl-tetrahydropterin synthase
MEVIKRKILLEEATIRANGETWGTIPEDTCFYVKIPIYQKIDDMGLFTDMNFIEKKEVYSQPDYSVLINKLNDAGLYFEFMNLNNYPQTYQYTTTIFDIFTLRIPTETQENFYNFGNISLSGLTDSKIEGVRSYSNTQPYK